MRGELRKAEAALALGVSYRSLNRYLQAFQEEGPDALYDRRHSNYHKIDEKAERHIIQAKLKGPHRSSRRIRDLLSLPVHDPSEALQVIRAAW